MKNIFLILFFIMIQSPLSFATGIIETLPSSTDVTYNLDGSSPSRKSGPFVGVGFGFSEVSLKTTNSVQSTFQGWNGSAEGGFNFDFGDGFGMVVSAEYKLTDTTNTLKSTTYMEKARFDQLNGKIGFYWQSLTLGGGASETNASIEDVSNTAPGQTQNYKGTPRLVFANYCFEKGNLRASVESEYLWGMINKDIHYTDFSAGVRFYILF